MNARVILVHPEYAKLLPELSASEYEALKSSIREEGQHYPIILNSQNYILDGHNRYRICQELGLEPQLARMDFSDPLLEKKFVITVNLKRRHLNDYQKAELAYPLLDLEEELAEKRQKAGITLRPNERKGEAIEIVAKEAGLSRVTFQRAKTVIEKAPEEVKEKLRNGDMSINYAYMSINRGEKEKTREPLPEGVFDIIYADPPWDYDFLVRGSPKLHYDTMSLQEIVDLKIPVADDAVLFLWTTNPMLPSALTVMGQWGFEYKTNLVWVKDAFGTGYYFRGQHELLLVGKKGNVPAPLEENRPVSVLISPRREHSRKPDEVYELIERMYPNRSYLELFARTKREGWTSWGK